MSYIRQDAVTYFRIIYQYMADHISEILSDYDPVDWTKRFDFHGIKKSALDRMVKENLITAKFAKDLELHCNCPLCKYVNERPVSIDDVYVSDCDYCPIQFRQDCHGGCTMQIEELERLTYACSRYRVNKITQTLYMYQLRDKLHSIANLPVWKDDENNQGGL